MFVYGDNETQPTSLGFKQGDRLEIEGKVYVITLDHNLDFVLSLVRDEKNG